MLNYFKLERQTNKCYFKATYGKKINTIKENEITC